MAKLFLSAEDQIQRLNRLVSEIEKMESMGSDLLLKSPEAGKWCVAEIISHMNQAYHLYENRIDLLLDKLPDKKIHDEKDQFRARGMAKMSIVSMRPVNGERKRRMKTMKRFEPVLKMEGISKDKLSETFALFYRYQDHLKESIKKSRSKDVGKRRLNSAIGPIVRFYLPEAFDFLISHEERHLLQAQEVIAQLQSHQTVSSS
jgi:hypothetical protein